jgi:hypothetical protein
MMQLQHSTAQHSTAQHSKQKTVVGIAAALPTHTWQML